MSRFHRIDPHRGYSFPDFAVAGGGSTSNVFCGKRWVVVRQDFQRAGEITIAWFAEHERSTRYLHTADLEALPQFQEPAVA